jgi:hypothetical protein
LEGVVGWEGKEEQGAEFEGTWILAECVKCIIREDKRYGKSRI